MNGRNPFPLLILLVLACSLALALTVSCSADDDDTGSADDDDDDDEIPRFVEYDYIELQKISRISRFRSGIGHDYSDDFETCRSMKHYYQPDSGIDWSTVEIYSPADGVVIHLEDGWAGAQLHIRSTDHPCLRFILFHVQTANLDAGDEVAAGEPLGTHVGSETYSDIAVGVDTQNGYKLVSYFDVMTDDLFQGYKERGLGSRGDTIITREERDADPLTCDGEDFADPGSIENWVDLDQLR